jgi:hypothetical protein
MKMKKFSLFLFAIAAAASLAFNTVGSAADCPRIAITEDDIARQPEATSSAPTRNWVYYTRTPSSTGVFRTGPGAPPSGIGSFEISTPTGADKGFLFNYDHVGTKLSDVNAIGYSTYRTTGSAQQVTALNIQVDFNGPNQPGGFTTLVFEPVYNSSQGPVQDGVWQTWDAYNGGNAIWWSTRPINGGICAFTCYVTWDQIVAANPDATILGGFGLNQGSGNPGLVSASDNLTIGYGDECYAYDFEPYKVATDKEACKQGGWKTLRRADGSPFKNQGDCVSYTNTGK